MKFLRSMVKCFEANLRNRKKKYDLFLQDHRRLPTSVFERDLRETRVSAFHNLIRSYLRLK